MNLGYTWGGAASQSSTKGKLVQEADTPLFFFQVKAVKKGLLGLMSVAPFLYHTSQLWHMVVSMLILCH